MPGISMSVTITSNVAAFLEQRERVLGAADGGHLVARGLEDRGEHVAEERRVVDEQQRPRGGLDVQLLAPQPVLEGERQEVADVDDLGRLALDHRRAEHAGVSLATSMLS